MVDKTKTNGEKKYGEYVSRVNQVDANELNSELFSVLKSELLNVFKYFKPGVFASVEPELNALLRFVVANFTIQTVKATIGQQLLLMKYQDTWTREDPSLKKLKIWSLLEIGCHWYNDRISDVGVFISRQSDYLLFHKVLDWSETLVKSLSLVNFLVFLRSGKYFSLLERVLCIRSVAAAPQNLRQLTSEYMVRELLWHGFAELLTVLIPLMNTRRLKSYLAHQFGSKTKPSSSMSKENHACAICDQTPCLPHHIGCQHVFCYYCIKSSAMDDSSWSCPVCSCTKDVKAIVPLCYS